MNWQVYFDLLTLLVLWVLCIPLAKLLPLWPNGKSLVKRQ